METLNSSGRRTRPVLLWVMIGASLFALSTTASATTSWRFRQASSRALLRGFAAEPVATDALQSADRAFLERALGATREQVRLAELASSQARDTEVRSLAQQILADHRTLADSLNALIRRKGAPVGARVATGAEVFDRLVGSVGGEFDREFLRTMADQHGDLFALFQYAAADAKDDDVRELAAAQLPTLRGHRNTIVELRKTLD